MMIKLFKKLWGHVRVNGLVVRTPHVELGWFKGEAWGLGLQLFMVEPYLGVTIISFHFLKFCFNIRAY
jgi:hypothetical protein